MKSPISLFIVMFLTMLACDNRELNKKSMIHLYLDEGEIDYGEKQYIEAHIYIDDHAHLDMARAKMRGGWSRQYPKKSYTINLQSDPSLKSLPKDNDWILNASYIDKTMMRHAFSYQLFREMTGMATSAPTSRFVEVYINHEYEGLYLLHPRMDRSFYDLEKSGSLFKDPPIFFKGDLPPPEEEENQFHQKYPKAEDRNARLADIRKKLLSANLCNLNEVEEYFELGEIINWHILLLVTHGSDGLLKNFYLYQVDENQPFRICIWDYDHSFGRDGDSELNRDTSVLDLSRNWLLDGLSDCPEYRRLVTERYSSMRNNILSEARMISKLDSMYLRHREAILKNGSRWSWDSEYYFDDNNSDEEIELMKGFIRKKMPQLDDYFNTWL